jgi:hypothetical protein
LDFPPAAMNGLPGAGAVVGGDRVTVHVRVLYQHVATDWHEIPVEHHLVQHMRLREEGIENHHGLLPVDAFLDGADDRFVRRAAKEELDLLPEESRLARLGRLVLDVNRQHLGVRVDDREQGRPPERTAAIIGGGFDDETGLRLVEDLLARPHVVRILLAVDAQPRQPVSGLGAADAFVELVVDDALVLRSLRLGEFARIGLCGRPAARAPEAEQHADGDAARATHWPLQRVAGV